MTGTYQEVVEPERLVITGSALDEAGNSLFEVLNMLTFAEGGDKTTFTCRRALSDPRSISRTWKRAGRKALSVSTPKWRKLLRGEKS